MTVTLNIQSPAMSFHTRLNEILNHCQLVKFPVAGFRKLIPCKSGYLLIEKTSDLIVVQNNIDAIYKDTAWHSVSKRWLTDKLLKLCSEKLQENTKFTKADEATLKNEVSCMPITEMTVIREVKGAEFYSTSEPLQIGKFTIYDWEQHSHLILQHCQHEFDASFMKDNKHKILAECKVSAAESRKISELAGVAFQQLENLLTFIVGSRSFDISITNNAEPRESFTYAISPESFGYSVDHPDTYLVNFSADSFRAPREYVKRLINIEEECANGLERKIARSVDWIAQALKEPNMGSAFIKAMIALESLLKVDEKGGFSSSLVAQISEGAAQILGTSVEDSLAIASDVKKLYGIRSSVVHSGSSDIKPDDLSRLIYYTRQVIFTLLQEDKYKLVDSAQKLSEHLIAAKYSHKEEASG